MEFENVAAVERALAASEDQLTLDGRYIVGTVELASGPTSPLRHHVCLLEVFCIFSMLLFFPWY